MAARQLLGLHLAHRRLVGADHRSHQFADTGAMARAHEMQRRERHEVDLERQQAADLVALFHGDVVPLVHGEDQRPAARQRQAQHARVLLADGVLRVDHHGDHVRLGDGLQRLRHREDFDFVFDLGAASHAGGVDEREIAAIALERHENAVARGAGHFAGDQAFVADEPIDQRGLADVGPADDGDADAAVLVLFFGRRRSENPPARCP